MLETCSGVVTAAVAERLGGFGHVCSTYIGNRCMPLEATRMLNFSDSVKQSMSTASLATLLQYQAEPDTTPASSAAAPMVQEVPAEGQLEEQAGEQGQLQGQIQESKQGPSALALSKTERQGAFIQQNGCQAEGQNQHLAAAQQDCNMQQEPSTVLDADSVTGQNQKATHAQQDRHAYQVASVAIDQGQVQQLAAANGAFMRDVLVANSEQPQAAVLTGLAGSHQSEGGASLQDYQQSTVLLLPSLAMSFLQHQ